MNEPLSNIINDHQNIAPENLLQIENEGNGNCLYLSISYHCFNNFKHQIEIRNNIANALCRRAEEMPNVTINDNEGNNIPIKDYAKTVYKIGNKAGDAEIYMIPLVYHGIIVATYRAKINNENSIILGYKYIQLYGEGNFSLKVF